MSFDQSSITGVAPPVADSGGLHLSWTSTAPAGSWFQVYVAGALAWVGRSTFCSVPLPDSRVAIEIGVVSEDERGTDFSAGLSSPPLDRALLRWFGGRYEGRDLAFYRVHGSTEPGGPVAFGKTLAEIAAYPGGIVIDGWGRGKWNRGGWGSAAGEYRWTSGRLSNGAWTFAVVPVDLAGNEGTPIVGSTTILAPPGPPAPFPDGARLRYEYDPATSTVTLHWNPSEF